MKLFDMLTRADIKRIKDDRGSLDLTKRIEDLDKSLSIALDINDKYQRENKDLKDKIREAGKINELHQELCKDLKKRAQEAEGELVIIKGIGNTSPEMKALQEEIEKLKADLARAREDHQYDNLVHQNELKSLRKK